MSKIIDGRLVSKLVKENLKSILEKEKISPSLAVILVGNDPSSLVYVKNKTNECLEVGISPKDYYLPEETTEEQLLDLIDKLNRDDSIDGILVQLPLPKHIDTNKILNAISPRKDVDGFHPENVGKLLIGTPFVEPCTPKGVIKLLEYYNITIEGKRAVVIGRSNIVGKPMAVMLLHRNATVTVCHSKSQNIPEITSQADILVSAVGIPNFVKPNMVKNGAVVIDIGINRIEENGKSRLVGDVEFDSVKEVASFITPVPGGVGLMTRAMLLENTINLAIYKKLSGNKSL
jgi:methylenetetrahydrofolate dehydrogenase (NADP+)/methenyltetrahydrofolate cyclohydrolase